MNACMSRVGERRVAPEEVEERALELLEGRASSNVPLSGCALGSSLPPVRSPRQCIGPWFAMPRRLWVVIGPFMGWNRLSGSPTAEGGPRTGPGWAAPRRPGCRGPRPGCRSRRRRGSSRTTSRRGSR